MNISNGNAGQILVSGGNYSNAYWADPTTILTNTVTDMILQNPALINSLSNLPSYNGTGPVPVATGEWFIYNGILTQAQ